MALYQGHRVALLCQSPQVFMNKARVSGESHGGSARTGGLIRFLPIGKNWATRSARINSVNDTRTMFFPRDAVLNNFMVHSVQEEKIASAAHCIFRREEDHAKERGPRVLEGRRFP